jgi:ABC-type sugar transport system permease subunit
MKGKVRPSRLARRRAWWGVAFIFPWLVGVLTFFVAPMIQNLWYSFNSLEMRGGALEFTFVGIENYVHAIQIDAYFKQLFGSAVTGMISHVVIIIPFSLLVALALKERFFGRTFYRAVFFLPVIIASGVVITVLTRQVMMNAEGAAANQPGYLFQAPDLIDIFWQLGVPIQLMRFISDIVQNLFSLTWKSGIQIILLLAALNSVPKSSYEVAVIEGATEWEKFWKITLPMVSPTMLVAVIYTIIDSFTDYGNRMMTYITEAFQGHNYAFASAMSIMYFLLVLAFVGVFNGIVGRYVVYHDK